MQSSPDLKTVVTGNRFRGLWRLMKGFRLAYLGAAFSLGVATSARTASLLLIRYFVDSYLAQGNRTFTLWMIAAGFVALAGVQGGFTFLSGKLAAHTAEGLAQRLRNYLLDHIQHLPFAYHDSMQTGELIQRVTSDVDALRRFFASQAIESSRIIFLFLINFLAILALNVQLAFLSIIVIPVILAISVYFFRLVSRAYEEYQEQEAVLTTTLQENLSGVRVVKAFARQEFEEEKFRQANQGKYLKGKRLLLMHSLYWPTSDILCGAQMLGGFTVGALMAINGTISVGTYLAYAGMVILIIWPIRNLGRLVVEMSRGLVSFERVAEVIRQEREVMDEESFTPPARLRGEIVFDDVSFDYHQEPHSQAVHALSGNGAHGPDGANGRLPTAADGAEGPRRQGAIALEHISFRVQPGQRVALLGATGAGKTTLVNLLPRFYDYTGGRILLDGVELKRYSRRYLRQQIGIVEQEPFLFSRTVRENITYSVGQEVSQEQVEAAARAAAIHDVIMTKLPHGYDTLVGERGTTLSGGQKQRVAIARTLLKDPRILILDDSTSAVDTETEAEIRQALERLMENRTTFIIAHRIQSVMNADLILVLNRGRIVQSGTHEELIRQEGMYRRIYEAQTRIETELQEELTGVSAN
ncbi:ABC transporter ATP-binding protein/permease [Litorilinea aerophila]|uniref:ABC transporter ATP-binding protein n=1 Tax=Litorilinea aerophila TaxID=1204385 RepID=UPI001B8803C7|nr:ABC transporter ATP-binding protein [Litorilinea aerophila]MCC9074811.1 ABC transporter ATP-binding protein/permease [Litorilinea aerophila]